MNYENEIEILKAENRGLVEKVEMLGFRTELLAEDTNIARLLLETNIGREQYTSMMELMEEFRRKIDNGEDVSHIEFEMRIAEITGNIDYHFAELVARSFMEDKRWEEVFSNLYGHMTKYGGQS